MNKKKMATLGMIAILFCLFNLFSVVASANKVIDKRTDIGVEFEKNNDGKVKPPIIKPPLIDGGGNTDNNKLLPQTGEMIASLIVMLIGLSIIVFITGVLILKHLYQELSWEY